MQTNIAQALVKSTLMAYRRLPAPHEVKAVLHEIPKQSAIAQFCNLAKLFNLLNKKEERQSLPNLIQIPVQLKPPDLRELDVPALANLLHYSTTGFKVNVR